MLNNLRILLSSFPLFLAPLAFADGVRVPSPGVVPEGEALISELGCLNCHAGQGQELKRLAPRLAPKLDTIGKRASPTYLRRWLNDPQDVRPGTSMPDLLGGLGDGEREDIVEDLVHFLVSRGGPLESETTAVTLGMLEEGRQLLHEVGCVACHIPEEKPDALYEMFNFEAVAIDAAAVDPDELYVEPGTLDPPLVPFGDQAGQTNLEALESFLLDPVASRPSGRMPSLNLTSSEARNIAVYLLRDQAQALGGFHAVPGLQYSYYEHKFKLGVLDFTDINPVREGVIEGEFQLPEHREDNFAFEFNGVLTIETSGTYVFRTHSDDGSWLYLNGELVVNNGGFHGMTSKSGEVELEAGEHFLRITHFELNGGQGLEVYWKGPDFEEKALDGAQIVHRALSLGLEPEEGFELDLQRAARGAEFFRKLGCAACHESTTSSAPALADCDLAGASGCLSSAPGEGLPRYAWTTEQREAVTACLGTLSTLEPLSHREGAQRILARNRCYSCHRRNGIGGPHPERRPYFFSNGELDLGEEGRIPPHLDSVGSKLQYLWAMEVLFEGGTSRPYLTTRMPQFGRHTLEGLLAHLVFADMSEESQDPGPFTTESMLAGRQLVGTDGFGCIQCHKFNGYDSLGIPAVDLGVVHDHVQFAWFRDLLKDPDAINMNTRMPNFLVDGESPVKDVLDGDIDRQIDAIWNYLSLGTSMPLPAGLNVPDSTYELEIEKGADPRLVGVFMKAVSPRVIAVGTPEHIHFAFDMENSRLAMIWRGRFFNARGTWEGRAGQLEMPASAEIIDMPQGPPFALLPSPDEEWPEVEDRRSPLRALGRRYDGERYPIFRYALGEIVIEETPRPFVSDQEAGLSRRFHLVSSVPVENLTFQGRDGRRTVNFQPNPDGQGYVADFEEVISW